MTAALCLFYFARNFPKLKSISHIKAITVHVHNKVNLCTLMYTCTCFYICII